MFCVEDLLTLSTALDFFNLKKIQGSFGASVDLTGFKVEIQSDSLQLSYSFFEILRDLTGSGGLSLWRLSLRVLEESCYLGRVARV